MRRFALLPLLSMLAACASAPPAKESWAEAGFAASEAEENASEIPVSAEELAARARLGPLAVATQSFGGAERVLRSQNLGRSMPVEAVRTWSALFSTIDRALAGHLRASRNDLLRARVAAAAELAADRAAYRGMPEGLDAAVEARVRGLANRLHGRRPPRVDDSFAWPVHPVVITSLFGPRLDPIDHQSWKRHEGVDIAADKGELVTAAARGVVVEAGPRRGYGLLVAIRHDDGAITRYGHLSQILTARGLTIERGGALGLAGSTGRSTGPHVHFEVWRHGRAQDPLEELGDPDDDVSRYVVGRGR